MFLYYIIRNEYEKLNGELTDEGLEYPKVDIPSNNSFVYTDINEIIDIFENNKDAVIYFGYPTCLYCRTAIHVLVNTEKNTELDVLYYMDVENRFEKYDDLVNVLG